MSSKSASSSSERERIKVFVRCRPHSESETIEDPSCKSCLEIRGKDIKVYRSALPTKSFTFDGIFGPEVTQEEVFNTVAIEAIDDVFKGYHATILVYGQTGTGKHTLSNIDENNSIQNGLIPRSVQEIFKRIKNDNDHEYSVRMSYLQIYMETLQDLLQPESKSLQIREDPEGNIYVSGLSNREMGNFEDCIKYYKEGDVNRTTALTKMNATSSRSHACVIINVQKRGKLNGTEAVEGLDKKKVTSANLFLVDLAGSERLKKTEAEGIRKKEANYINLSLTTLGLVVHSLEANHPHIPFRDSKLTRLLQDSLGGNGKTRIVVTIAPNEANCQETVGSLLFGERAMNVKTTAKVNESIDYKALCVKLKAQLETLEGKYSELEEDYLDVTHDNDKMDLEIESLIDENKSLKKQIKILEKEQIKEKEKIVSLMKGDLADLEKQHEIQIKELNQRIETISIEYAQEYAGKEQKLTEIINKKASEIDRLETTLGDKQSDIDAMTKRIQDLENEVELLTFNNEQLQRDLEITVEQYDKRESELENVQELIEKYEKQVLLLKENITRQQEDFNGEQEALKQTIKGLETKIHEMEAQYSSEKLKLQDDIEELKKLNLLLSLNLEDTSKEHANQQKEWSSEKSELERQIIGLHQTKSDMISQNTSLNLEITNLNNYIQELQQSAVKLGDEWDNEMNNLLKIIQVQEKVIRHHQEQFKHHLICQISNETIIDGMIRHNQSTEMMCMELRLQLEQSESESDLLRQKLEEVYLKSCEVFRTSMNRHIDQKIKKGTEKFGKRLHDLSKEGQFIQLFSKKESILTKKSQAQTPEEIASDTLNYMIWALEYTSPSCGTLSNMQLSDEKTLDIINSLLEESERRVKSSNKDIAKHKDEIDNIWRHINKTLLTLVENNHEHNVNYINNIINDEKYLELIELQEKASALEGIDIDFIAPSNIQDLSEETIHVLQKLGDKFKQDFDTINLYSNWLAVGGAFLNTLIECEDANYHALLYLTHELLHLLHTTRNLLFLFDSSERETIVYKLSLHGCASKLSQFISSAEEVKREMEERVQQYENLRRSTDAALIIQRFYRRYKKRKQEAILLKQKQESEAVFLKQKQELAEQSRHQLLKIQELQMSEMNFKAEIEKQTAKTGRMLLKQSLLELDNIFNAMKEYFLYGEDDDMPVSPSSSRPSTPTSSPLQERSRALSTSPPNPLKENFGGRGRLSSGQSRAFSNAFNDKDLEELHSSLASRDSSSKVSPTARRVLIKSLPQGITKK
ncbi:hypothetical protein C9374_010482 [Naegleria lovaniensis]|uniref:Kinesin motor domain-containing protein n=1 Tax=Naegleria lovaniensis TaxID=51637 RepID=A0AA88GGG9_NAELO|nr:uncharacterized protein C9374_010482 [Naegleria lovaniensis]KAG2374738.1 hypothetical protein C9374_010482 [Naegleria lovaniensis]